MRLFFALQLPESVKEKLRDVAPRPEQLHFTLAFLGETERVDDALAAGSVVRECPAFELVIGGAGAFPSPSRPHVLWLGAMEGAPQLCAVAEKLRAALLERGFQLEERPFRPHLTLAHVKPGRQREARRTLASVPSGELARFNASEICLMQSVLGAGGAKHTVLRAFTLREPG